MAVTPLLASVKSLRTLLRVDEEDVPDTDPYALLILEQASDTVRHAARQPGWVRPQEDGDTPGPDETLVPIIAAKIALWLAYRVYVNPSNLSRRTSGPVTDTFSDNGLVGMELTANELADLVDLRPDSATGGGLWVQPIDTGRDVPTPVYLYDNLAGPIDGSTILYADPVDAGAFE